METKDILPGGCVKSPVVIDILSIIFFYFLPIFYIVSCLMEYLGMWQNRKDRIRMAQKQRRNHLTLKFSHMIPDLRRST